ncbi:MAG: class I SAM-dependent methyltransferase [Rhodospirillales bacterium]|nr:class I SAM-dependent methyltransferase [Rhodospirillales bacterium]
MKTDHRWDTSEYEARTRQLYRTELHKLYPSEAWALYRILPQCASVLDLGCGNGAMAAIARQIAPEARYIGMDHQANLMKEAKEVFPYAEFEAGDLVDYIRTCGEFDCVMSWSVIKSFGNWREVIDLMLQKARKYVICDIRVANTDFEAFDDTVCWADYGGRRGPITYLNYGTYRDALLKHEADLDRIEIAGYQSEWGQFVHLREDLGPETFLIVSVLVKKDVTDSPFELFERLPGNLSR